MNTLSYRWLFKAAQRRIWSWKISSLLFASKFGKSNPISFALRPLLTHPRLRFVLGISLVILVLGSVTGANSAVYGLPDTGGPVEVVLNPGEPNIRTVQAVRKPLDKIDISQHFWGLHSGIDFRAPVGTPIWPVMSGVVIKADNKIAGYGNLIVLKHDNGYETWYAHLSKIRVKVSDKVDTSQIIGEVGSTGRSTGPHLHLELREPSGRIVNPGPLVGLN